MVRIIKVTFYTEMALINSDGHDLAGMYKFQEIHTGKPALLDLMTAVSEMSTCLRSRQKLHCKMHIWSSLNCKQKL